MILLFGGQLQRGGQVCKLSCSELSFYHLPVEAHEACTEFVSTIRLQPGHLRMQGGHLEFFMAPELADIIWKLREELDELLQRKVTLQSHRTTYVCVLSGPSGENGSFSPSYQ